MAIENGHLLKDFDSANDHDAAESALPKVSKSPNTLTQDAGAISPRARNILLHAGLIFCYTFFAWFYVNTSLSKPLSAPPTDYLAISTLNVTYNPEPQQLSDASSYFSPPTPELDAKWDALLAQKRIRVSADELARNERTSVSMGEGKGYLAWLGAFHELHCLNFARMWKYREYYHANRTEAEVKRIEGHVDHCMDRIRAVIMCRPDVSDLITMYWDKSSKPMVNGTRILDRCVDWDALMESTNDRQISLEEMSALENPSLEDTL